MGEKRIVVPEGMLKAVIEHHPARRFLQDDPKLYATTTLEAVLEAALRWISENPRVPTDGQAEEIALESYYSDPALPDSLLTKIKVNMAVEWQRRMFLAPEPNSLDDLYIFPNQFIPGDLKVDISANDVNVRINEAYRRGQQSREK